MAPNIIPMPFPLPSLSRALGGAGGDVSLLSQKCMRVALKLPSFLLRLKGPVSGLKLSPERCASLPDLPRELPMRRSSSRTRFLVGMPFLLGSNPLGRRFANGDALRVSQTIWLAACRRDGQAAQKIGPIEHRTIQLRSQSCCKMGATTHDDANRVMPGSHRF